MTGEANGASGGWKQRLFGNRVVRKTAQRFPFVVHLTRFVLRWGSLDKQLLSEMIPKLHQDVQAARREVAQMQAAAAESSAEVRQLKHRYAEYYGAIVEQLREQNRRLDRLAEQQERILQGMSLADVLALEQQAPRLPQAGYGQ